MTEAPLTVLNTARVWVIPPTPQTASGGAAGPSDTVAGYVFPWSWGWKEAKQLIPVQSRTTPSAMGSADFQLLRATRQEIGRSTTQTLDDHLVEGSWICITVGDPFELDGGGRYTDQIDATKIAWLGWISTIDAEQLAGTTERIGSVGALEVGHLLDTRQIYGWSQMPDSGQYATSLGSPPQANIAGPENSIIGNAIVSASDATFNAGSIVYAFTRLPSECKPATMAALDVNVWTRWRLLQHLTVFCQPQIGPGFRIIIATADGSTAHDPTGSPDLTKIADYLNDTTFPEVYELTGLTWRGGLDMLIPEARGLGWFVTYSKLAWTVTIYTIADDGSFGVPVNPGVNVNLPTDTVTSVTQRKNAVDLPDEIVYESAEPVIFGFTIGGPDNNLGKMWSAQQELDYKAGASGDPGYAALTQAQQRERNSNVRNGPGYRDVYTKLGLNKFGSSGGRDIVRYDPPIVSRGGSAPLPLVPGLRWDGTTLAIDLTVSRTPYLPTARFMRTLPWPEGLLADGTDKRDPTSVATPQYLPVRLFRYDSASATNGGFIWIDLLARNGRPNAISLGVDVDDRSPALRITASPPELLAYKHWSAGSPALSDVDPETDGRAIDYATIVATVAMESDQRIQIVITRPGIRQLGDMTGPQRDRKEVRRQLIIRDDKLRCWIMLKGSILGIKADGTPDSVSAANLFPAGGGTAIGYALRNDWGLAQRRAKQLAAFVFRKRTAVTLERARSEDFPTWGKIGTMITKVIEVAADATQGEPIAEVSLPCATVVVEVVRTYGPRPRMRISTGLPTMISVGSKSGAAPSASSGGRTSATNGGPLATQVDQLRQRANAKERDDVRIPLITPKGGSTASAVWTLLITGGNTLSDGSTLGIKYVSSVIASVPSAYNPNVDTTFIDGIGRAQLAINGVLQTGFVLVVHDSRAAGVTDALFAGDDPLASPVLVNIPIAGDPNGATVTCYLPLTP